MTSVNERMAWTFGLDHVAFIKTEPPGNPEEPLFLRGVAGSSRELLRQARFQLGWLWWTGWNACVGC